MTKLVFDAVQDRKYENGISNVALFVSDGQSWYKEGVAWNGVSKFAEQPEGGEITAIYADNIKYLSLVGAENIKFSIECYTYPDEWAECDGSASLTKGVNIAQQPRKSFAAAYITNVATEANPSLGRKLHLLYGCKASPSERSYETINNDPAAMQFSYSGECTPVAVDIEQHRPTALITIDEVEVGADKFKKVLDFVYGNETKNAKMPKPGEVFKLAKGEEVS